MGGGMASSVLVLIRAQVAQVLCECSRHAHEFVTCFFQLCVGAENLDSQSVEGQQSARSWRRTKTNLFTSQFVLLHILQGKPQPFCSLHLFPQLANQILLALEALLFLSVFPL